MEQTAMEKPKGGDKVKTGANRYAKYGVPEPLGVKIDKETTDKAVGILKGHGTKGNRLLVKYLRDEGTPVRVVSKEGDSVKTYTKKDKGEPYGALVAFKYENNVYIGWSKRNCGYVIGEDPKTKKKIWVAEEPLRFTKKDALWVAILRALTDTINKDDNSPYKMSKGTPIPRQIARKLNAFIARTEKYFGKTPINLR